MQGTPEKTFAVSAKDGRLLVLFYLLLPASEVVLKSGSIATYWQVGNEQHEVEKPTA